MKAKRRVCAFLFSALMIWQGFMIVNAEGAEGAPVAVADGVEEAGTENATATPGRGATDGKDTTLQEGDGSGSGLTALKAPTSEAPAQQVSGTPAQTGTGSVTPTEGGDSGSPATSASSVEAGEARESDICKCNGCRSWADTTSVGARRRRHPGGGYSRLQE